VLNEIPRVRKDLGYIPLVTPTSQIVGTQAVLNVLTGERYKSITKETAGVLKGEYGATAAAVNSELQEKVLDGAKAITSRPADHLPPEVDGLTRELQKIAKEKNISLAEALIDDVLTYALFPQIGLKFLENRNNPSAFEPAPCADHATVLPTASQPRSNDGTIENYSVKVDGKVYEVTVGPSGSIEQVSASEPANNKAQAAESLKTIDSPLSGNIFKVLVHAGDQLAEGDVVIIMEAMKMETEIRASSAGTVVEVLTKEGDAVRVGDPLVSLD